MSPDQINQYRAFVIWCTRAAGTVFVGIAVYRFITRVVTGFNGLSYGVNFFSAAFGYLPPTGGGGRPALLSIVINFSMAAILFLIAKRLGRWIITMPADACPACGYPRPLIAPNSDTDPEPSKLPSTYCPECGLHGFAPKPQTSKHELR